MNLFQIFKFIAAIIISLKFGTLKTPGIFHKTMSKGI